MTSNHSCLNWAAESNRNWKKTGWSLLQFRRSWPYQRTLLGSTRVPGTVRLSHFQRAYIPVMGTSGRGCSFLQDGTNTVMSVWPRSRNQFTASRMPRQEKTSLFPWLAEKGKVSSQSSQSVVSQTSVEVRSEPQSSSAWPCWATVGLSPWPSARRA